MNARQIMDTYVSIIIPVYNREQFVDRAIKSVLSQIYQKWELIVVDDGSSDNTGLVVKKYLTDLRIRYIKKSWSGAAHSRNVGVENATHELITFLDSDDEAETHWLSTLVFTLTKGSYGAVCCGVAKYCERGKIIEVKFPVNLGPSFKNYTGKFSNGGTFLIEKDAFMKVGGYDEILRAGQHTELALRLLDYFRKSDVKIVNIRLPLIKIHHHGGNRIRNNAEYVFEGTRRILDIHKEKLVLDKILYRNYLFVLVHNGMISGKILGVKKYLEELLKGYPLEVKSWYYLLRFTLIRKHLIIK